MPQLFKVIIDKNVHNKKGIFMVSIIKTKGSSKAFSIYGGLILSRELLEKTRISNKLESLLPKTRRNIFSCQHKFEALLLGFQSGNEHLEDWDALNQGRGFEAVAVRTALKALEIISDHLLGLGFLACKGN